MALRKKRPYEQELEGSTVKTKCLSLVSDHVMKDPTMQNINLKLKLDHQNKKWTVKKPDRRHHSDQSRQEPAPASTTDMTNTHHQQQGTMVNRVCLSPPEESTKVPVVRLFRLNIQTETKEEKSSNEFDTEQHHEQEPAPDDEPMRSKSSPSSTTEKTNTHHQLKSTTASRVCTFESSKVPVVHLFRLNIQTETQERESTTEFDTVQHYEQESAPDEDSVHSKLLPSNLAQNELSASTHHQQQGTTTGVCLSPPEESTKVPVVRLFRLNIQTEKDESTNERESEQLPEQEPAPDDHSVNSKSSSSPLAHNELLASTTEKTSTHHQQKGTRASRVCLTPLEESSKVPVVRLFRLNMQTETQEEESTKDCDTERLYEQEHRKTDKQERPHGNTTYTSLEEICRGKQPVVKLYRVEKQLEEKELSKLDSEHNSAHELASPSNSDAHDGTDLPPLAQNAILSPKTDDTRKHDQQEETLNAGWATGESDNEHHYDHVQHVQSEDQEQQPLDDSDSDQFEQNLEQFSAYEIERLKNIKQNAKFLKSLRLLEIVSSFGQQRKSRPCVKREKPQSYLETRRSKRIQGKVLLEMEAKKKVVTDEVCLSGWRKPEIPTGPIKMFPTNQVDDWAWKSFQDTWKSISIGKFPIPLKFKCQRLTSYKSILKCLTLEKGTVAQIHPAAVCSTAVHPSNTQTLVAAGDLCGNVGLWDLKGQSAGAFLFPLHAGKTSVAFSPSDPRHLVTLGQEGTIRCGDISCSVFDEIYRKEEYLTSFDFLSASGSVLIVSHSNSKLSVVDRRTPTNACDVQGKLRLKYTRTVSVHPLNRDHCAVAGSRQVCIYDVRMLNMTNTKSVTNFPPYSNEVLSASFSPVTGNHILICLLDGNLRTPDSQWVLWGIKCFSS
ncbi:WD repeat-containing protein 76 isoform X2 [Bufo gargarizans]|uniref:WD repeat-containing protein 76 isoform X2 n=1 Tax=Bufo gargarizans TaxID=30331 RepID=UPI001CF5F096|nr:WD repeat-containing protein 76 isoform X2 [Bufo gargarizans]